MTDQRAGAMGRDIKNVCSRGALSRHTSILGGVLAAGRFLRRRPPRGDGLARRPQRRPPPRRPSLVVGHEHRQTIDHQRADVRRLAVENEDGGPTLNHKKNAPAEVVVQLLTPHRLDVAQREAAPFARLREVPLEDGLVAEFL